MKQADKREVVNELKLCPKMAPAVATIKYILDDFLVSLMICTLSELF